MDAPRTGGWPVLTVLGAAGTVTGSKHLIEHEGSRVLVDCGLYQGMKDLRLRNWAPFPVDPSTIDAVVVTHAHLDHCGHLPRLATAGFDGPVYATPDTRALMGVVLPDSGRLNEEDAHIANVTGSSKHHPALPLYTEADSLDALRLVRAVPFGEPIEVADGVEVRFDVAGHILGSATVRVELRRPGQAGRVVRMSGDLGRPTHPLLRAPEPCGPADLVVVESTYGDREHDGRDPDAALEEVIRRTVRRGGTVVIPTFAIDRADVLLHHLGGLARAGRLPEVPIHLDSPMALSALAVYRAAIAEGHPDVRPELVGHPEALDVPGLHHVHDADGSRAVSAGRHPAVVLAGAGMAAGGRVVHHLEAFLPDPRSTVVLVGFQAAGTRGRALLDGADVVKIHGRYVPVRAEVVDLTHFSVHADRHELLDWVATADGEPDAVLVVHGEPDAAAALRRSIRSQLDWNAVVPSLGERVSLRPSPARG